MIVYQSRFLVRGEVWFDNSPTPARVDWIQYHQRSRSTPNGNWRPFYTRVLELTLTPDTLFSQMDGFTAADIKKAKKKDQTRCRRLDPAPGGSLHEFEQFYDRFAALKGLPPADRQWLERTAAAGKLDLWLAESSDGQPLVYHVFYRDPKRVRSFHTASLYAEAQGKEAQRRIGRANRLLIWESLTHFRDQGVEIFDLGGWYPGKTDTALLGVNKFKEGFGGKIICEFEGEEFLTLKGRSAVTLGRLFTKIRERGLSKKPARRVDAAWRPALQASD